jgi:molecular chaperone DnaK (HSP70)
MSNQRIVGIDLGTTNSLVAFMQGDVPVVIPGDDGLNLVPSVVALNENDQIIVGNAARKYLIETPERAVYSIKRLMGRGIEDIREELKLFPFRLAEDLQPGEVLRIKLGDKTFTPPEISASSCASLNAMLKGFLQRRSRRPSLLSRRTSTTRNDRPRRMQGASPDWKYCVW